MRTSILAFSTALLLVACGDSGSKLDGGSKDMAGGGGADMTSAADMVPATMLVCADLIGCENPCTSTKCITDCEKMATTTAKNLLKALDTCIQGVCFTGGDAGTGRCADTMSADCMACIQNTQRGKSPTGMTNSTCSPTTDPGCGLCVDQLIACGNDM